jgi:hypothetical protein
MKMNDMRVTAAEKAAREVKCAMRCDGDDGPDYPWGLSINLDQDSLAKLGITTMPKLGDVLHIEGIAKVNSLSENSSEGSDDTRCVGLQIMILGTAEESETKEATAGKLYDNAGARKAPAGA